MPHLSETGNCQSEIFQGQEVGQWLHRCAPVHSICSNAMSSQKAPLGPLLLDDDERCINSTLMEMTLIEHLAGNSDEHINRLPLAGQQ